MNYRRGEVMEIRVLGPLEVWSSGQELPLAGARVRTMLALLALNVGRVVAVERLVDALWDGAPPETAVGQVYTTVWQLRRLLGGVVESRSSGYRLQLPSNAVDLAQFEAHLAEGRAAAAEGRAEGAA
ncbi:MAG: AfsR/SARP family transcriptional regulator, partial [Nocardioides sp.]